MLNTNPEPLNAINVGVNNDEGPVNRVMSLKKLASVGCVGEFWRRRLYELTIADAASVSTNSTFEREKTNNGEAISLMENSLEKERSYVQLNLVRL